MTSPACARYTFAFDLAKNFPSDSSKVLTTCAQHRVSNALDREGADLPTQVS